MRCLNLLILFFLFSCTQGVTPTKSRNIELYYQFSGVEEYFLPEVHKWFHFSEIYQCPHSFPVRYFDVPKVRGSFGLSYREALHFQYAFNVKVEQKKNNAQIQTLSPQEFERIFFSIQDRVQAKEYVFRPPTYFRYHLVVLDAWDNPKDIKKLKRLFSSEGFQKGHPIVVSFCLNREELEKRVSELDLEGGQNIRLLSYEVMSIYDNQGKNHYRLGLQLDEFFPRDKKIFYYHRKKTPTSLWGNFSQINLE